MQSVRQVELVASVKESSHLKILAKSHLTSTRLGIHTPIKLRNSLLPDPNAVRMQLLRTASTDSVGAWVLRKPCI